MNDFDDLDDVFGPLRSAATDAELAAECSLVDAMARQHRRQKGHNMFTSRRARVATFVAAGVLGFGGIAAAGPGGPSSRSGGGRPPTTTVTTEVTTTTSESPSTTSEVTTTTSEVKQDDDALKTQSLIEELPAVEPEADESECVGDGEYANHGEYVSAVAHADDDSELAGVEQRDAAQSSCGKEAKGLDDDEDEDELEKAEADEVDDDDGDHDDGDHDEDDDEDDDDEKDERSEKSERSGRSESSGKQGNGSKKHSDDD